MSRLEKIADWIDPLHDFDYMENIAPPQV